MFCDYGRKNYHKKYVNMKQVTSKIISVVITTTCNDKKEDLEKKKLGEDGQSIFFCAELN